ncbi:hypothetical protein LTR10_017534 [Elasticomyces elasticus]|uniref:SMP domain-containing protein n=1 Tax=Exophiala sideris TaxID=1016849 RepID=A0ABR0IZH4_9EURO|nr:hypothetical protein LTR10_017534 [Elasticomyces elasticus]KAK5023461.1 hypothetical protein LTS07_009336 [Exophiala sideris]KAK5028165.1 hypothetical protein LTR13_009153 [Exophiala sideris]KAK5052822.1 hypothetical protein LTR69_009648 [Exophiala sideris]KAK5178434.1 hypothetical protein LTR44_009059 [Eurotiomycetes sp. CCFEE 6388]
MENTRGGHAEGYEPDSLDANQHGIAQNTIDEEKSNYGANTGADRDIGSHMPTSTSISAPLLPEVSGGKSLTESVDEALKGATGAASDKAQRIDESVKVGDADDLHEKAASKQP